MRDLFSQHGEVVSCALPTDRETGRPRGFGFIEMSNEDGRKAIEALDGQDFGGRQLRVNEARPREARGGGGGGAAAVAAATAAAAAAAAAAVAAATAAAAAAVVAATAAAAAAATATKHART